jgi:D-glycero-alpha-D-manno-heptose-7-phosphate kinase
MGDIPSAGSGLGSSSTVTVGSLHAMHSYQGELITADVLARQACEIEIERLGKPIGVQDQYIVAFGGLRFIEFGTDGVVRVEKVALTTSVRRKLNENLLLFYTGIGRRADTILSEQKNNIHDRLLTLRKLKEMAHVARRELEAGNADVIGELLHESWQLKKELASQVSNGTIDAMYDAARRAGATGGKITGAGGGGFLLLYCPHEHQEKLREALVDLQELPFTLDENGSKVIFDYKR